MPNHSLNTQAFDRPGAAPPQIEENKNGTVEKNIKRYKIQRMAG